jgi:hypothetical protein
MNGYVVTVSAVALAASSLALAAQSYMGTARKDCFGTAANTGSKAWYTVADGVLSDVYSPTIENSNDATCSTSSPTAGASPPCSSGT